MMIDDENVMARYGLHPVERLQQGVYKRYDFGSFPWIAGYQCWPDMGITVSEFPYPLGSYGVCDDVQQIIDAYPTLQATNRSFVVMVTQVDREDQSEDGGWRWHKWGEYIGKHAIQHEYLYDEEGIDSVLVYHIYEKTGA